MSGGTNTADMGAIQRTLESILERADRQDAAVVKLTGRVDALGLRVRELESPESPEPVDPYCPPEAERVEMVKKLRAATLAGIEANKTDRNRAGRTYRKESGA